MSTSPGSSPSFSLHPSERFLPVRRLSPEECDLVGFAGPLVLSELEVRWIGPWRPTGRYVVVRHPDEVVLACSRAELAALGVDPGAPRGGALRSWWGRFVGRSTNR
jgi:hypothetical protein